MLRLVIRSLLTGMAVGIGVSAPWSFLAVLNLRVSPQVHWALAAGGGEIARAPGGGESPGTAEEG